MTAETTTVITCTCKVCKGRSARVRGTDDGMSRTLIHNMVCLAHGPLAGAGNAKKFGPWAV
jgi:hypothetical protein